MAPRVKVHQSCRLPSVAEVMESGLFDCGNLMDEPVDVQLIYRRRLQALNAKTAASTKIRMYCHLLTAGYMHKVAAMESAIPHQTFFRWLRTYPACAQAVAAARLGEWRPEVTEQEWEAKAAAQAARMRELADRRKARMGAVA
jgi:hypothetical protein